MNMQIVASMVFVLLIVAVDGKPWGWFSSDESGEAAEKRSISNETNDDSRPFYPKSFTSPITESLDHLSTYMQKVELDSKDVYAMLPSNRSEISKVADSTSELPTPKSDSNTTVVEKSNFTVTHETTTTGSPTTTVSNTYQVRSEEAAEGEVPSVPSEESAPMEVAAPVEESASEHTVPADERTLVEDQAEEKVATETSPVSSTTTVQSKPTTVQVKSTTAQPSATILSASTVPSSVTVAPTSAPTEDMKQSSTETSKKVMDERMKEINANDETYFKEKTNFTEQESNEEKSVVTFAPTEVSSTRVTDVTTRNPSGKGNGQESLSLNLVLFALTNMILIYCL